jgi:hypothetical protein
VVRRNLKNIGEPRLQGHINKGKGRRSLQVAVELMEHGEDDKAITHCRAHGRKNRSAR